MSEERGFGFFGNELVWIIIIILIILLLCPGFFGPCYK